MGRALRRDRRPQLLPVRQGLTRRAPARRVAVAEGTEQRTAQCPGLSKSHQGANRLGALNINCVGCRRARANCRVSVADCRLPIVGRFDAPSFRFAVGDGPRSCMRLRVGNIFFGGKRRMTRGEYESRIAELNTRYPYLFPGPHIGHHVPPGWLSIVSELCAQIDRALAEAERPLAGLQVTPKGDPWGDNHASAAFCRVDDTQPDGGLDRVGKVGCGARYGCPSSERR